MGPLRIHPHNPRYFTADGRRAVYLTGSHTWNNLVDMGPTDPPPRFDYDAFLDTLASFGHNFLRLWAWELLSWNTSGNGETARVEHHVYPHPWKRTGPGQALDGKPRFNLVQFDEEYLGRLHDRLDAAQQRGIYVAVMLFEGWGLQFSPNAWPQHPFHPRNNVNGVDGDLDGDGKGLAIHTGRSRQITQLQHAYVRQVVDIANPFDNVLYEISNENHPASTAWQYQMIDVIHEYERSKPKQHPVGMTFQFKGGSNQTLFDSPADWISPNPEGGYQDDPPPADGAKVILNDTDHLWGIGGNVGWIWKNFLRGMNPIFMDPYDGKVLRKSLDGQSRDAICRTMGYARSRAGRIDLARLTPHGELASSQYCLANPGIEYLAYHLDGQPLTVDLSSARGEFRAEWFDPLTGQFTPAGHVAGGAQHALQAPFASEAVLHLRCV